MKEIETVIHCASKNLAAEFQAQGDENKMLSWSFAQCGVVSNAAEIK